MSYKRSKYPDDSLVEDVYNKLHRLGRYASRQELLDEIRDLNLELEREKKILTTYRGKYEDKLSQSASLNANLSTARDYQDNLLREQKELETKVRELKSQSEGQKQDIGVLKKELETKDVTYLAERRRLLDDRLAQELGWDSTYSPNYRYWHLRPWLYSSIYYPYSYRYPYYADYESSLTRRVALDGRMDTIRSQIEDLKLSNSKMLSEAKKIRNGLD